MRFIRSTLLVGAICIALIVRAEPVGPGAQGLKGSADAQDLKGSVGAQDLKGSMGAQDQKSSVGAPDLKGSMGAQDLKGSVGAQDLTGLEGTQALKNSQDLEGAQNLKSSQSIERSTKAESTTGRKLRILSLMTVDTASHHIFMASLTVRLAEMGHEIHSVDVMMPKRIPPTLNVTLMENAFTLRDRLKLDEMAKGNKIKLFLYMIDYAVTECRDDFETQALKTLVDPAFNATFDLILVDYATSDCLLGFIHKFNYPPTVALTPFPIPYWMDQLMGNPPVPSIVPIVLLPFQIPMTLVQRLITTATYCFVEFLHHLRTEPAMTDVLRETFGPNTPSAAELRKHISVAFVNEVVGLQQSRPLPPSIIPVGGMHVTPANMENIPADLKQWLDEAEHGFIFVSFGSLMRTSNLEEGTLDEFLKAFGTLKQRVLWKLDEHVAELPPNVRTRKWLPQNDILGHPNLRLFISHCGGLSTLEFTYHAVPVLGVPFFMDQFANVNQMQSLGLGKKLLQDEITKHRLITDIEEIINNPKYRENARRMSLILRDQKETPLERAVWWVEYVARHGGAPHLRSPALDLPWHQVMLLDVIAVFGLGGVVSLFMTYMCWRVTKRCLSLCRASQAPKRSRDKQE